MDKYQDVVVRLASAFRTIERMTELKYQQGDVIDVRVRCGHTQLLVEDISYVGTYVPIQSPANANYHLRCQDSSCRQKYVWSADDTAPHPVV